MLPHRYRRTAPYLYTEDEIRRLITVAKQLPSATGLRPATYATLLGLLAVTGLRISEALALNRADVDGAEAVLTIFAAQSSGSPGWSPSIPRRNARWNGTPDGETVCTRSPRRRASSSPSAGLG